MRLDLERSPPLAFEAKKAVASLGPVSGSYMGSIGLLLLLLPLLLLLLLVLLLLLIVCTELRSSRKAVEELVDASLLVDAHSWSCVTCTELHISQEAAAELVDASYWLCILFL